MTSGVPTDSQLRASHEPVERPVEASMWSRAYVLSAVVAAIVLLSVFMRTRRSWSSAPVAMICCSFVKRPHSRLATGSARWTI